MYYNSYKTMCDSSLAQIRKSENKRQELDHKLQKMFQEKSECEKSIIKTFQSQQRQFTEDQRRRTDRNESILRQLDRIDYQASALAAKTERLKSLKKQYERYLLTLWNRRRQGRHSTAPPSQFSTAFVSQYNQPPYAGSDFGSNYPVFTHHNAPSSSANHMLTPQNYPRNQSTFAAMPPYLAENSIRTSNYRTTGAVNEQQFPHPPTHQVLYDDLAQIPQKKSFHHNDRFINNDDMTPPTTINSIYNQQQHSAQQFSPFAEKLSTRAYQPLYQPSNQALENHNYRSESFRMSETLFKAPLFPSASTQLSTQSAKEALSSQPSELLFKNHLSNDAPAHMSDGDEETESDGEKPKAARRSIHRSESISDDTFQALKTKSEASSTQRDDRIDNSRFKLNEPSVKHPQGGDALSDVRRKTSPMNDLVPSENMHQVWEKIVEPVDAQNPSSFVIPKIVVDTQIDLADAAAPSMPLLVERNQGSIQEKDSPGALNHEGIKRSTDNQRIESVSLASAVNNISPLTEAGSSIYHYDKQPLSDEQQNHQQQSRVEHELSGFGEIKISDEEAAATRAVTHESEIKTNNSLAEGNFDDGGVQGSKETINNNNDDKNQGSSSTLALNDKINEIYRKIEKIEDKYYDEKGKIIESFERRMSTSSLGDSAKTETKLTTESVYDSAEVESQGVVDNNSQQENVNYGVDSQAEADQHQSEIAANWSEPEPQEATMQPDYNYSEPENQQIFTPQPYDGTTAPSDDYSQQFQVEGQQQPQFDYQYDAGAAQTTPGDSTYEYEQPQQYQDYNPVVDPYQQQQSDSVYSYPDNTQQQQEANNYIPSYAPQSDSNYQQSNYDGTQENPSNYTNDSTGVYYDYDQNQQLQQQQQPETLPQMMYDDQNYSHQQPATFDGASSTYYGEADNKANVNQEHSNENNYGYAENLNETSGDDGTRYIANEYQTDVNQTNMYESQTANEMTLENANYETQQFEQDRNDSVEHSNVENYGRDESFLSTTASESSEVPKPVEIEAGMNVIHEESTSLQPTKRDDVKLVKQLLDSESDDTSTSRSNLLKTSIIEEAEESDFDFSAS